ncbi:MAG: hypothetical protein L3J47_06015 [Sulfurovum sp.]|nr:hypothetical protein [Sulfurovum sp.]
MLKYFSIIAMLLLAGCQKDATVTIYDKQVTQTPISCLALRVVPENRVITQTLRSLYHFDPACKQRLEVSYKSGIVCNSPYNAPQKTLSTFPSSYLNMEIRKGFMLQYSYYVDLDHKPDESDVKEGFERIASDLKLISQ